MNKSYKGIILSLLIGASGVAVVTPQKARADWGSNLGYAALAATGAALWRLWTINSRNNNIDRIQKYSDFNPYNRGQENDKTRLSQWRITDYGDGQGVYATAKSVEDILTAGDKITRSEELVSALVYDIKENNVVLYRKTKKGIVALEDSAQATRADVLFTLKYEKELMQQEAKSLKPVTGDLHKPFADDENIDINAYADEHFSANEPEESSKNILYRWFIVSAAKKNQAAKLYFNVLDRFERLKKLEVIIKQYLTDDMLSVDNSQYAPVISVALQSIDGAVDQALRSLTTRGTNVSAELQRLVSVLEIQKGIIGSQKASWNTFGIAFAYTDIDGLLSYYTERVHAYQQNAATKGFNSNKCIKTLQALKQTLNLMAAQAVRAS